MNVFSKYTMYSFVLYAVFSVTNILASQSSRIDPVLQEHLSELHRSCQKVKDLARLTEDMAAAINLLKNSRGTANVAASADDDDITDGGIAGRIVQETGSTVGNNPDMRESKRASNSMGICDPECGDLSELMQGVFFFEELHNQQQSGIAQAAAHTAQESARLTPKPLNAVVAGVNLAQYEEAIKSQSAVSICTLQRYNCRSIGLSTLKDLTLTQLELMLTLKNVLSLIKELNDKLQQEEQSLTDFQKISFDVSTLSEMHQSITRKKAIVDRLQRLEKLKRWEGMSLLERLHFVQYELGSAPSSSQEPILENPNTALANQNIALPNPTIVVTEKTCCGC